MENYLNYIIYSQFFVEIFGLIQFDTNIVLLPSKQ